MKPEFQSDHEESVETQPTGQARPNVLFEAGMAMGRCEVRTILVQVGKLRPFSDVGGRHVVRLTNSSVQRQELAMRLKNAGCTVDLSGTDWHSTGSFELVENDAKKMVPSIPATDTIATDLSAEEEAIIAKSGPNGVIIVLRSIRGECLQGFQNKSDPAFQATYREALDSLVLKGVVRKETQQLYRLSALGFKIQTAILAATEQNPAAT